MKIVATTLLPAVDRPNADRWNAARSRQNCDCLASRGQNIEIWEKWFFPPISARYYATFKPNLYICWSIPLRWIHETRLQELCFDILFYKDTLVVWLIPTSWCLVPLSNHYPVKLVFVFPFNLKKSVLSLENKWIVFITSLQAGRFSQAHIQDSYGSLSWLSPTVERRIEFE